METPPRRTTLRTTDEGAATDAISAGGNLVSIIPPSQDARRLTFVIDNVPANFETEVSLGRIMVNLRDVRNARQTIKAIIFDHKRSQGRRQ